MPKNTSLALFLDELKQFFPSELIRRCMTIPQVLTPLFPAGQYYLGVDIARLGSDQTVLISATRINKDKLKMFDMQILEKYLINQTAHRILELDAKYHYKKIYIDDAGVGAGVYDFLNANPKINRRIVAINNSKKSLDEDKKQKRRLLKEDLYANLLMLMERGKIDLINDEEIFLSLSSIQYEYNKQGQLIISGTYSHICE